MPLELHPARPDRAEQSNVQDYRQRPGEVERYLQTGAFGLPLLYELSHSWIYSRIHWPKHFAGDQFPLLNRRDKNDAISPASPETSSNHALRRQRRLTVVQLFIFALFCSVSSPLQASRER